MVLSVNQVYQQQCIHARTCKHTHTHACMTAYTTHSHPDTHLLVLYTARSLIQPCVLNLQEDVETTELQESGKCPPVSWTSPGKGYQSVRLSKLNTQVWVIKAKYPGVGYQS